jgi:hypothetical protein
MSALEQDRGRDDIRSERNHGGRSERSRRNMPVACLSGKASSLGPPRGGLMMDPALREETHFRGQNRAPGLFFSRDF